MQVHAGEENSSSYALMLHSGTAREVAVVYGHILSEVVIPDVDLTKVYIYRSSLCSSIVEEIIVYDKSLTGVLQVDCSTSKTFELIENIVHDVNLVTTFAMHATANR